MEKLENIGSYHFPIYVELTFEPEISQDKQIEEVSTETQQEVPGKKIEKGQWSKLDCETVDFLAYLIFS